MQLLKFDLTDFGIFDRTDFGKSNLSLPNGQCRNDPNESALKIDCTAHSAEYDVATNTFRALFVQTDVWCSSGAVIPDGRLIQTGGFTTVNEGSGYSLPTLAVTGNWQEIENGLAVCRWYATNHILPDGQQIVIGGRRQFNYELYPKSFICANTYSFAISGANL
jgi:hypothetical protein